MLTITSFHTSSPQLPWLLSNEGGNIITPLLSSDTNTGKAGFSTVLKSYLNMVNQHDLKAQSSMTDMESGADNLLETVMAIQKADRSLQMLIQVRNRVTEAWHEVLNQPV